MDWAGSCCMQNNCILKITIAAVIYVIKFKPPEFATSKDYALHLKNTILSSKEYKELTFETEKESLIKDLLSISGVDQTKLPPDTQSEHNNNKEHLSDEEDINENTNKVPLNVKTSLEFIEALVHIRNATNSRNSIALGKFQAILSLVSQNVTGINKTPNDHSKANFSCFKRTDCFQSLFAKFSLKSNEICEELPSQYESQDSGYSSLEPLQNTPKNSYVLSSDINQVMRKNKSDLMLAKSVQVVLDSLAKTINSKTLEADFWRAGSILETSVTSIVKLVESEQTNDNRTNCQEMCTTFVKSLIETISSDDKENLRLRCTVIRELSESPYICKHNITNLLHQISVIKESIFEKINSVGEDHFKMCALDIVEEDSLFVLYTLLKELLLLYVRKRNTSPRLKSSSIKTKPLNICAAWKDTTEEDRTELAERIMVSEWRTRLEELSEVFSEYLTNIMFFNFECLNLLEEHLPLADTLDKG